MRNRVVAAVVIICIGVALVLSARVAYDPRSGRPGPDTNVTEAQRTPSGRERYLRGLTNGLRYELDRSILPWWDNGMECAHQYAKHMARTKTLDHSTSTAACPWNGENVGKAFTINQVHTGFANSSPHRSNLLFRGFTRMAIGIVFDGRYYWVVERFKV